MNLLSVYTTPIWESTYPEFSEHKSLFLDVVKKYKEENPSEEDSNIFGYQSPKTLQTIPELSPLYQYVCEMAFKAIVDLEFIDCDIALTSAWLNVNDTKQCMNGEHIYDDVFTGVFHLHIPEKSGPMVIKNQAINPMWKGCKLRSNKNQLNAETIRLNPGEGGIVLLPAYLPYYVEPNDHDEERITISFNIIALPKGTIQQYQNNPII